MKCVMFVLLVFVACTTAEEGEEIPVERFMELFSISAQEVKTCIHKTGVKREHLVAFGDGLEEGAEVSKEFVRKASCYLVCCAHAQGTMVGSQLQMEKIVQRIRDIKSTYFDPQLKAMFITSVKQCEKGVKGIADACDVVFVFIKCLRKKF
ncbi:hypothetical protein ANTPLA_LOCUS5017 [Anthophora plagiata]